MEQEAEAIGVMYIKDNKVYLKTKDNKDFYIGDIDGSGKLIPIEAIMAKMKLLEGNDEQK